MNAPSAIEDRDEPVGFTIFFAGDLRKIGPNPFLMDSPFGKPVVISVGDVFAERDELERKLREAASP